AHSGESLQKSEAKAWAILANAADGILTTDAQGRIEWSNPTGAHIFEFKPEELAGKNIRMLVPGTNFRERNLFPPRPAHAEKGSIISIGREVTGKTKEGREFPLDLSVSVVRLGKNRVFIATVRNITKRKTAEAALSQSREQLRLLAAHLQSVREDERKRIAQEVHEVLGQALTGIKMDLSWMTSRIRSNQKPVLAMARSAVESVNETIQMVRRIATELRPGVLDNFGLVAAIEWQAGEFEKRTGIRCQCIVTGNTPILDQERLTAIFRLYQEALAHASKHTRATQVIVSLNTEGRGLHMEVRDNGQTGKFAKKSKAKALRIVSMQERALFLGGDLSITEQPGAGTLVSVKIPWQAQHARR
ncbi:MAG TPA: PAS domain-containing sensor histidine kinase, partial [Candidatus Saccharimonadales bacterium]|nr:PAS domain-containing sensor histidine kinase [Candidatus Saccharimonadales bacterium]